MNIEEIWYKVRYYGDDSQTQVAICRTVERLPKDVQSFVFDDCVFMSVGRASLGLVMPPDRDDELYWARDRWLIFLADELPEEDVDGIIAHEIAHALLGHNRFELFVPGDTERTEQEVADQVKAWGFTGRGARLE